MALFNNGERFSTDAFLSSSWIRTAWAAFFALFVLWGISWFMRHAFGQADDLGYNNPDTVGSGPYGKRTGVDPETTQTGAGPSMTTATPGTNPINNTTGTANPTTDTAYTDRPGRLGGGGLSDIFLRINRSSEMLRDLLLMLLSVMVLNSFGKGLTRAVAVIAWIFFGLAVIFALLESFLGHRFLRLAYTLIFFGLALAIGGIAFAYGFWF